MSFIYDPSLVLYVPLQVIDGSPFMSRDVYGHRCTVTGARWTPQGRSFDGSDDIINCGNSPIFDITSSITLEAWANLSAAAGASKWPGILDKNDSYSLRINENSTNIYGRFKIDGITRFTPYYTAMLETWYHAVITYCGHYLRLYINGVEQTPATSVTGTIDVTTNDVQLGRVAGAFYLNGLIGEARIYRRALTPAEIQRNYLATKWRYR